LKNTESELFVCLPGLESTFFGFALQEELEIEKYPAAVQKKNNK